MQEERVRADVGPVRSAQHESVIRELFFLDDLISGDERYAGHETSLGVTGTGRVPHQRSARNTVTPSTWRRCSERVRKPPVIGRGAAESQLRQRCRYSLVEMPGIADCCAGIAHARS